MEKTIEQWFDMLPEPIRSEALEARRKTIESGSWYSKCKTSESLHDALSLGFSWETDGGSQEKWEAICYRAEAGEFDTKPTAPIDLDSSVATITAMRERIAELERENKEMAAAIDAISKTLNP